MTNLFGNFWRLLALFLLAPAALAFQGPTGRPGGAHTATGTIEVAFAPWDDGEALILRALAEARHDIHVQAFLLTSRGVAKGLMEASRRGVKVQVLADAQNVGNGGSSQIPALARAGIAVALETRYASAHNKLIIIDAEHPGCAVITGSYNFTRFAREKNAENLLLLKGDATLARAYLANWRRHRADAQPYAKAELKPAAPKRPGSMDGQRLPFPWEPGEQKRRGTLDME